jgi:ribosomal protein S18 acetylase RimI-like enzyme
MRDTKQLEQPPWSALTSTHAALALGNALARRYPPDIAPMVGIREVSAACLDALAALMRPGDDIVGLFGVEPVPASGDLVVVDNMMIEQMIYEGHEVLPAMGEHVPLTLADVSEVEELVALTNPGPFARRTMVLGSYIGIRDGGRLAAMAGERMRFNGFTEISAVCTHPDYRGRGHAFRLVSALTRSILARSETPFLHIFSGNASAGALYRKLGFHYRRSLTVTVLKKHDSMAAG